MLPARAAMTILLLVALSASPSLGATAASSVHIDAHAVTCQSFNIGWTGGTPPFHLTLQNVAAPEPALVNSTRTDDTFVWTPNVPAGTSVLLQLTDSDGTLAETTVFEVQKGTDTSCVLTGSSFATNSSSSSSPFSSVPLLSPTTSLPSSSSSSSPSSLSSSSSSSTTPLSATSGTTGPSYSATSAMTSSSVSTSRDKVPVAAIVVPLFILMMGIMLFLFMRVRKARQAKKNPFEDPENIVERDMGSVSRSISPFESTASSVVTIPPAAQGRHVRNLSEKSLPAPPSMQSQVTPQELQLALDRIQEMYAIMRELQSTANSSVENNANERILELQRQIEDLMADNAVLSGEQPPDYDSARR